MAPEEVLPEPRIPALDHHRVAEWGNRAGAPVRLVPGRQRSDSPAREGAGGGDGVRPRLPGLPAATPEVDEAGNDAQAGGTEYEPLGTAISAGSRCNGLTRGLSRMRGNSHVRFLGGPGPARARGLPGGSPARGTAADRSCDTMSQLEMSPSGERRWSEGDHPF